MRSRFLLAAIAAGLGFSVFSALPLRAQFLPQAPSGPTPHRSAAPSAAPPAAPRSPLPIPRAPTIVANANLVNVIFSVRHKHGFVAGLTQADFRVLEDGVPQHIEFFSAADNLPLTIGWLLDTSPSQINVLPEEQALSGEFFQEVLRRQDLAFVLGFDANLRLLQDLTASQQLLAQGVNRAHIGGGSGPTALDPGPFPTTNGGGTRLWDAIVSACRDRLAQQVGRKAIVVITDGQDQGSRHSPAQAAQALMDSNTVLFAVIAADPEFYHGFYGGAAALSHVAKLSGGQTYYVRGGHMGRDFAQIATALRSQYSLAYRPSRPLRYGGYRRIQIQLVGAAKDQGKVRARAGYYAGP
ncbi:MAG: VWA domain-containing protein [Terriglobales bacterium]